MSQANAALRSWMRGRTCADAGGRISGGSSVAGRRGLLIRGETQRMALLRRL